MFKINPDKQLSIKQNMLYNSIGNFIYGISQWLLVVIVTRLNGYEDAGVLSLAIAVVAVLYTISLYGMRVFQATDVLYSYSDGDYITSRIITVIISLPLCVAFIFINGYSNNKAAVIGAFMLYRCIEACSDVFHGILQRKKRMDYIGISVTIRAILILIAFVGTLSAGGSLWLACLSMAVASVIVLLFFDIPSTKHICNTTPTFSVKKQKSLLWTCFPLMSAALVYNAVLATPRYYLERIVSDEILGVFSALYVPTLFITSMATYLLSPIAVEFGECAKNNDYKKFMKLFYTSSALIMGVSIIASGGAYILGDFALKIFYGKDMSNYIIQFVALTFISGLYALIFLMGNIFTVLRWLYFMLITHIIVFVISIAITPQIISSFELWGAVFVTGFIAIIYLIINIGGIIYLSRKSKNEKLN